MAEEVLAGCRLLPLTVRGDERGLLVPIEASRRLQRGADLRLPDLRRGGKPGEQLGVDPDEVGLVGSSKLMEAAGIGVGDAKAGGAFAGRKRADVIVAEQRAVLDGHAGLGQGRQILQQPLAGTGGSRSYLV